MSESTHSILRSLPKADLHCHLDGSLRLDTILDLAQIQGITLPCKNEAELRAALHMGNNCESLEDYLKAFELTLSVLQTEDALYRAAYELAEDAAKENVWYMEVRYAPLLHTREGLPLPAILQAVLEGMLDAQRDFGIQSRVIVCGIRNMDPMASFRMAELAIAFKHQGVVAFDLAGAESDNPAKDHVRAFQLILNNNVNCTLHAGEAYGPESIHQAIHYCGAHRIGHGVRLAEDGDLLNYVNDHRIALEVCPTSNVQTGAVKSLEAHPLRFYYDYGLRVTVNTDNRLITDTTVTQELIRAHDHMGFSLEELIQIIVFGFKASFLPLHEKRQLLLDVNQEIETITSQPILPEEVDRGEVSIPSLRKRSRNRTQRPSRRPTKTLMTND
ncbi:MAG: adenosine deaminase [Myxococcota bacterium]|nr:adenosine deaminase [Myxococcota bacterium]